MAEPQVIESERLLILPFTRQHLTERYVNWLNDPEIVRYSEQRFITHTLESCLDYLHSYRGTPNCFWAICVKDKNIGHIGNINAYLAPHYGTADLGIIIGEKGVWGCGYAKEAWLAVCEYLFEKRYIRKITAGTLDENTAMLKLMKRTGMVKDGRRVRQAVYNGKESDIVYAALFKEDFVSTHKIRYSGKSPL